MAEMKVDLAVFVVPTEVRVRIEELEEELDVVIQSLRDVQLDAGQEFRRSYAGLVVQKWLVRLVDLHVNLGSVDFTPEFDE